MSLPPAKLGGHVRIPIELKKARNAVIRNILCAPTDDERPSLSLTETELLKAELKKNLISLNIPRPKRPWRELKKVGKEKRKILIRQFNEQLPPDVVKAAELARQMRSYLFLGLNEVSCGIEGDSVACCLLAEDVSPPSIVNHVFQLASHAKVPVFAVEGFKKFCLDVMGFSCMALGIAKPTPSTEPHPFANACSLVQEFYQKWDKTPKPKPTHPDAPPPPGKHHSTTQTSSTTADAQEGCDFPSALSFHLTRRSKYERAFTPSAPTSRGGLKGQEIVCLKEYEDDDDDDVPHSKTRTKYKLPTVLRIRNNPFKLKHKKKKKKKKAH